MRGIVYACIVVNQKNIIAEYPQRQKTLRQLVEQLINEGIPKREHKKTKDFFDIDLRLSYQQFRQFDGFSIVCISDMSYLLSMVYDGFINSVYSEYMNLNEKDRLHNSKILKELLRNNIQDYNNPNKDKITKILNGTAELKQKMLDNIDKIMSNSEKIDGIILHTDDLVQTTEDFSGKATKLKKTVCWQNFYLLIVLAVVILVVLFIGVWLACGFTFQRCIPASTSNTTPSQPYTPSQPTPQPK